VKLLLTSLAMLLSVPAYAAEMPLTLADLAIDAQVQLQPDEGKLIAQLDLQLHVDAPGTLELKAFALPVITPLIAGETLQDALPNPTQALESQVQGSLEIARLGGQIVVRGKVSNGAPVLVRLRYPIAVRDPHLVLGWAPGVRSWLTVALVGAPPVRIKVALDRPARYSRFEQGRERLVGASLAQPLAKGQVLAIALDDLPVPPKMLRHLLFVFGLLLGATALTYAWARPPNAEIPDASAS